ncbi:MAG: MATE family efflux transporter [Peptococcaceae bacterium]|jgi:putative MATE family efflux protein|nr:MATE family efflux transporter [Peptococcaceae bacterium]
MEENGKIPEIAENEALARGDVDFSAGSVRGHILRLAVPMTAAQVISLMYSLVDRMYLGRLGDGTDSPAMTAIGIVLPVISIFNSIASLCGFGGATLFSISRGEKKREEAAKVMGNAFMLLLLFGVTLTLGVVVFLRPIIYAFGASDAIYPYAAQYLRIYTLGTVFVMVSHGMNPFINAQGAAKRGTLTVLLGAVVNIILDPIFIFLLDMGTAGAALATVIAQFCSFAWVLHYLIFTAPLRLKLRNMRLEAGRVRRIITLGVAGFVMNLTNSLIQIVCNRTLQMWGDIARVGGGDLYVGVMTVINAAREIVFMPVLGVAQGATPVLSYNYGARKFDRVREAIRFMAGVNISYTLAFWAVIMLAPQIFIHIFTDGTDTIAAGLRSMRLYFAMSLFSSLQMTAQQTFMALGKPKPAIFFSLLRKVVIAAPLTLLLPWLGFGVDGVFLADTVSQLVGGISCGAAMFITVYRASKKEGFR